MRKVVRDVRDVIMACWVLYACVVFSLMLKFGLNGSRMRDDMTSLARSEFLGCETLIVWRREAGGRRQKGWLCLQHGSNDPCSWKISERTSTCGSMQGLNANILPLDAIEL